MITPKRSALVVACVLTAPSFADVTIKQTMDGKALGLSGQAAGTTYIKGNKMRSDAVLGNRTHTTIFDLDAQKMYAFDSRKKQADIWDMAAFASELAQAVDISGATGALRPNGQTKQIAGQAATGYDFEMTTQAGMAAAAGMTVTLTGPIWIVEGAPGSADYGAFYAAAVEKGWIFSDPRVARAQPGQAKAVATMYEQIAETGGIAYETDIQIKLSGTGPMAAVMERMGGANITTSVNTVETDPLGDDLFLPPADYKLNTER